jgi:O-methyltransferase involved in polyketide biosynthesis
MDSVAERLLMYLQPEPALGLIAQYAKRFPGGQMLFDLPPIWFAKLSRYGLRTLQLPQGVVWCSTPHCR